MNRNPDSSKYGSLGIVLAYAVGAALWILFSDKVVEWLFDDPAKIVLAGTLKGWLFVALTSLLLYGLLRRRVDSGMPRPEDAEPIRRDLGLTFVLLVIAIVAITGFGIARVAVQVRDKESARLQAIADLKVRQITDWLKERRGDAEFIRSSIFFAEQYRRWREAGDSASGVTLQTRLDTFRKIYGFDAVTLLDPEGRPLWNTTDASAELDPASQAAAKSAAQDHEIRQIGPYLDIAGRARLDFVVPLATIAESTPIIILHTDPRGWLYSALQTWPVPSSSGETLIFRREGDHVLFLNELRHVADAALKLRVPIAGNAVLAAQVARGDAPPGRLVEGVDYRGVPALGVVIPIPSTDWFLVAKLDRVELYGEIVGDAIRIALAGLLAVLAIGAGTILLRQRERLKLAKAIRQSQAERLRALRLLDSIADSSDDAIFAKDPEGRYILCNRTASKFVGKSVDEILGCDDRAIFSAEQARMLMTIDRQTLAENRIRTREETLDMPHGQRIFLVTKGPLRDDEGNIIGTFGISRDITERKRAEKALRQQAEELYQRNEELERFNRVAVQREMDIIALKQQVNDLSRELGREPSYALAFLSTPGSDRPAHGEKT